MLRARQLTACLDSSCACLLCLMTAVWGRVDVKLDCLSTIYADKGVAAGVQMMFTCVSMVLSLTIFAYILGEISNLVMDQDAELVKTRSQVSLTPSLLEPPAAPPPWGLHLLAVVITAAFVLLQNNKCLLVVRVFVFDFLPFMIDQQPRLGERRTSSKRLMNSACCMGRHWHHLALALNLWLCLVWYNCASTQAHMLSNESLSLALCCRCKGSPSLWPTATCRWR